MSAFSLNAKLRRGEPSEPTPRASCNENRSSVSSRPLLPHRKPGAPAYSQQAWRPEFLKSNDNPSLLSVFLEPFANDYWDGSRRCALNKDDPRSSAGNVAILRTSSADIDCHFAPMLSSVPGRLREQTL